MKKHELAEINQILLSIIHDLVMLDELAFDQSDAHGASLDNVNNQIKLVTCRMKSNITFLTNNAGFRFPKMRDYL